MSLLSKLKNLITLCKTTTLQNGAWKVTLFDGQTLADVPHMQNFGFHSSAPTGAKGLLLSRGGEKSAGILVVLEDDDSAPSLAEGEVAIYNNHGTVVKLQASGDVLVDGGSVNIQSGDLEIAGTKVVTNQQPPIVPPSGGVIIDAEARAAVASVIITLQTHGLTL